MATRRENFRDSPEFERGHRGERMVAALLRDRGYAVIPTYDYTTAQERAPLLQSHQGALVLPDLDVSTPTGRFWVEVKTHNIAAWNVRHECYVHGVKLRHAHNYEQVSQITQARVRLAIVELSSVSLLTAWLDELEPIDCLCSDCRQTLSPECLRYYRRDQFLATPLDQRYRRML